MRTKFWLESLKGRDQSEDLGMDGRIGYNIKMNLREIGFGHLEVVDWIILVQDRDRWRALVNTVLNFQVP
jgi:hypothetical protein